MSKILKITGILSLVLGLSFAVVSATQAKSNNGSGNKTQNSANMSANLTFGPGMFAGMFGKPAVTGTISAINGNSLTVNGSNSTVYTVDASNARLVVTKPAGTSLANAGFVTGDTVNVFGTVSGTNVAATAVIDGTLPMGMGGPGMGMRGVHGTVSAINGNSITLNANGTTFTVDATNAKISQFSNDTTTTIQVSGIKVGDTLNVRGTISGTNIAATVITDGMIVKPMPMNGQKGDNSGSNGGWLNNLMHGHLNIHF